MRLGLQQRIFPAYRRGFFELLAQSIQGEFSLFAGDAQDWEHVNASSELTHGYFVHAHNLHLGKGKFYFCYQANLLRWLRNWNLDCVIMEANPRYLASRRAIRWMHQRNRPVIGWGLGAPQSGNGFERGIWRKFIHQFDALIAYSQKGKQEYIALGVPAEKVFVAPNAVLPVPIHDLPSRSMHTQLKLLYVGRLQARKKVDELIKVCAELHAQGEDISLVVVGDGPERQNLEAIASQFFPDTEFAGSVYGKDLQPYFHQADLFVLPGTGGLAVQEALSYGLPVIVAEADGTQTNMVRSENGWVIDSQEQHGLLTALHQALRMKDNLPMMGEASYQIARDEVNINQMVKVFSQAIAYVHAGRE